MILANIILFLSIVNFVLTVFILLNTKREKQHISFLIFSLITTVWLFNNFLLINNFHNVYPLSYGLGIIVITSVLIWIYYFLQEKLSRIIRFFIIPFSFAVFFVSSFTNYIVYPITAITPLGYEGKMGRLFPIYSIYIGILVGISLYKLFKSFLKEKDTLKRKQILFVLVGATISGLLAFIVNFLIPLFFETFKFIKLVNLAFFPLLVSIIYSTVRHQLFGIKIVATQFLVAIFLSLLLLNFLFSTSLNQYYWNGFLMLVSAFLSYFIIRNMFKEIKLSERLLKETQKNLDFEQRLRKTYAEIAEKEIKSKYFKE